MKPVEDLKDLDRVRTEGRKTNQSALADNEGVSRHAFQEIGVPVTGVLAGSALERMSDEALIGALPGINLFCRVNPQQKHRVLLALKRLKRLGHVVGFMGNLIYNVSEVAIPFDRTDPEAVTGPVGGRDPVRSHGPRGRHRAG